ncbi:hypothetical protein [Streptomyces sp. NPDC060205]|uniref:hypothetical protein n=1 Tax=Streptomyces sp. NPDC060205 TaxID=3347072 RepID=UPI00364F8CC2
MSVVWAATSPESGLFQPAERHSEVTELSDRFSDLRSRGQGYVEVRSPHTEFPVVTLAFRGDHAVIHLMRDTVRMSLLVGDGTVVTEAEVPVMNESVAFSGEFVLNIDRAWDLVTCFIRTWAPGPLGEWSQYVA